MTTVTHFEASVVVVVVAVVIDSLVVVVVCVVVVGVGVVNTRALPTAGHAINVKGVLKVRFAGGIAIKRTEVTTGAQGRPAETASE